MNKERELLRRALEAWDDEFTNIDNASVFREIRDYLASEPESDKPVAWTSQEEMDCISENGLCYMGTRDEDYNIPLYTKPVEPERKPMTVEEMRKAWNDPEELTQQCLIDYCRAIEKYHGIGREDE